MGSVELSPADLDAIVQVAEGGTGVDAVYLFGSHARGHVHRESDVDLAVLLDRATLTTAAERFDARVLLISLLVGALHRNDVDVVVLNDAPPLLARAILRTGRRMYCRDEASDIAMRWQVQARAADLDPFVRRMRRIALETIRA